MSTEISVPLSPLELMLIQASDAWFRAQEYFDLSGVLVPAEHTGIEPKLGQHQKTPSLRPRNGVLIQSMAPSQKGLTECLLTFRKII
jgi:hypothetical protein